MTVRGGKQGAGAARGLQGYLLVLACLVCCIGMLCLATGCRDSDALKEIIYEQDADIIDYENEEKFLISNPDSELLSEKVSSTETVSDDIETLLTQNLVVYSSDPNNSQYVAAKAIWDPDPDFFGIEASEAVWFTNEEDEDPPEEQEETISEETEDPEEEDIEESESGTVASETASEGEAASGGEGVNGEVGSGGVGESLEEGETAGDSGEAEAEEGETGDSVTAGDEPTVNDLTGDFADPTCVNAIAAYGELAVIVQMIGGENALAATDATTLSSSLFQKVFADEGAADIAQGWSDSGSASAIDVDAIIESGAEAILVTSSDYSDDISSADIAKLNEAGITFEVVNTLTNSTFIKKTVTTVGKMLKKAEDIGEAGNTVANAKAYKTFHDDLIDACVEANGGVLASYDSTVYEKRNTGSYTYDSGADWTLVVDAWDSSVTWAATGDASDLEVDGIALSTCGYSTRATSFYVQAGGLLNNAAIKTTTVSGMYIVWQYGSGYYPYKCNFSYAEGGYFDESATSTSSRPTWAGNGWGCVLLCIPYKGTDSLSGSVGGTPGTSFGSSGFPKLIAATQEIKEGIIASSAAGDITAYKPYEYYSQASIGGQYAPAMTDSDDDFHWKCWASVGAEVSDYSQVFASNDYVITDDSICVAPYGITSWTEGTSAESVLLSAWVCDEVNDDSDEVGWESYLKEFYSTFYRYDLTSSDVASIEAGAEE